MRITYSEFHTRLVGARSCDDLFAVSLNIEGWLWERFAFADNGAHYIQIGEPEPWQPSARFRWQGADVEPLRLLH